MREPAQAAEKSRDGLREQQIRKALYRGHLLTMDSPAYLHAVRSLTGELLREDSEPADLTVEAMGLGARRCGTEIRAKVAGVAAGGEEAAWLYERFRQKVSRIKKDGEGLAAGDLLLRVEGDANALFALERVVVNLLQRMCGIATATLRLSQAARRGSPAAHVVGTRKTPWGLLDKRAVHWGGGGTHRLNLGDAILIKTNHLRLAGVGGIDALEKVLRRAWQKRGSAAFFEVEVTRIEEALMAGKVFRELPGGEREKCPCLLLLDNFSPAEAGRAARALQVASRHEAVILEASGGVSEATAEAYARAGVEVISAGALTHSVRALDLSATMYSREGAGQK